MCILQATQSVTLDVWRKSLALIMMHYDDNCKTPFNCNQTILTKNGLAFYGQDHTGWSYCYKLHNVTFKTNNMLNKHTKQLSNK